MRAALYRRPGLADEVLEVVVLPEPLPQPGQVRVRMRFSGVNPTDWKRRLNEAPPHGEFQIPNQDGSGVIDMVGPGVDPARIGEEVWVFHGAVGHWYGTAAELLCVTDAQAVRLPEHITLEQGALIGIPYMTAAHALSYAPAGSRPTVLVQGGAGAVGFAALQLGRHERMRVITTVSSDDKAAIAAIAQPDAIVNYRSPDFPEDLARSAPEGFGLVTEVDLDRNLPTYVAHLQSGAHVAAYASDGFAEHVPVRALMFRNANLHFFVIYALPQEQIEAARAKVSEFLQAAPITTLPIREYSLEETARAHDDVQQGLIGRAVIRIE